MTATDSPTDDDADPARGGSDLLLRWGRASWQIIGIVAVAYLGLFVVGQLRVVVVPVIVAVLLSTQLVPLDRFFRRPGVSELLAAWMTFLILIGLVAVLVLLVSPPVWSEIGTLGSTLGDSTDKIKDWLVTGPLDLSRSSVDSFADSLSSQASNQEERLLHGVISEAPVVVESLAAVLLTVVLVFFFVKDGERIVERLLRIVKVGRREGYERFGKQAWRVLTSYVRGSAANGLVNAVVLSTALLILGIPLVIPIAVFTFFGSFLPVIGGIVSGGLAAAVALVESGPVAALVVIGVTVLIHHLESYVVGPMVMRRAVNLHPVAVILSIATGSLAFGLLGAFLAVPVVAVAVTVLDAHEDAVPAT